MPATVLVVDDDYDIRQALAEILHDEGFNVRLASNGLEALESIASQEPDLLLLDLMMPIMNGWELMRVLKRIRKRVPTIVLSAGEAPDCDAFVQKPISLDRLLSLLESVRTMSMGRIRSAPPVSPAQGKDAIANARTSPQHRAMSRGRVFIVDDDEDTRTCVAGILEAEGYEVRTAANGRDALRILEKEPPPHLMLLDLMMPVMTGWDVLDEMARIPSLASLATVVFSAADDSMAAKNLSRPLLRKPIDLDLLLEMVDRLCAARSIGDEPPSDLLPKPF